MSPTSFGRTLDSIGDTNPPHNDDEEEDMLQVSTRCKFKDVQFVSGYLYQFTYSPFQNDSRPLVIWLNKISGINQSTNHEWRLWTALNLNYIPRADRKRFGQVWCKTLHQHRDTVLTWNIVKRTFPYLEGCVRRYQYSPVHYINNIIAIPFEDMEDVINGSMIRDYSNKIRMYLGRKFRNFFQKPH